MTSPPPTFLTIAPGLCSITFRSLATDAVIALAERAGTAGIEWGSDTHVPPTDLAGAEATGRRCRDAGIEVVSYGTYLGAGAATATTVAEIEQHLDAAEALGAPMIRAWTEFGVTPVADLAARQRTAEHTAVIADAAAARGLLVALEFHPGTFTETAASTNALLDELGRPNLLTHWQPDPAWTAVEALEHLTGVLGRLAHLHVFAWGPDGIEDRLPLGDGADLWAPALALADSAPGPVDRYALCEYVLDDDPDQFVADSAMLRRWSGL